MSKQYQSTLTWVKLDEPDGVPEYLGVNYLVMGYEPGLDNVCIASYHDEWEDKSGNPLDFFVIVYADLGPLYKTAKVIEAQELAKQKGRPGSRGVGKWKEENKVY